MGVGSGKSACLVGMARKLHIVTGEDVQEKRPTSPKTREEALLKTGLPNWKGFTLVELMIVIVIVALLAAIAAPSISRSVERNRVADLNRAIANGFLEARSYSMRTGEVLFAEIDATDGVITFMRASDPPTALSCPVSTPSTNADDVLFEVIFESIAPEQEILRLGGGTPGGVLCFSPSGRVLSEAGRVIRPTNSCGDMNFYMVVGRAGTEGHTTCPDLQDDGERVQRELDFVSFIHVSATGNVRVMR